MFAGHIHIIQRLISCFMMTLDSARVCRFIRLANTAFQKVPKIIGPYILYINQYFSSNEDYRLKQIIRGGVVYLHKKVCQRTKTAVLL